MLLRQTIEKLFQRSITSRVLVEIYRPRHDVYSILFKVLQQERRSPEPGGQPYDLNLGCPLLDDLQGWAFGPSAPGEPVLQFVRTTDHS